MTYPLLESALWCGAGAAVAWRFTALHFQSRLNEATQSLAIYKAWWERDSGRAIVAEASLDLIHQQHVDAGRKAHAPFKALRAETTEKLMQCVAKRDANEVLPAVVSPSAGVPAEAQRSPIEGGSGQQCTPNEPTGRGRGVLPPTQAVAPQRQFGRRSYPTNRAVESAPAEFPQRKGA